MQRCAACRDLGGLCAKTNKLGARLGHPLPGGLLALLQARTTGATSRAALTFGGRHSGCQGFLRVVEGLGGLDAWKVGGPCGLQTRFLGGRNAMQNDGTRDHQRQRT